MLSYMRARVPNLDNVCAMCQKHGVILVEDNAHGYGCTWTSGGTRRNTGTFGVVSTISTQSNKVINSGEGGFIFTSNDDVMSYCMFAAGCYEALYKKHGSMCPPQVSLDKFKYTVANYSCRMSNVAGAMVYEQIKVLQQRIDAHNQGYAYLKSLLETRRPELEFIPLVEGVSPVYDSLQLRVNGGSGAEPDHDPELEAFVKAMGARGIKLQIFFTPDNARYYKTWQFMADSEQSLPLTNSNLRNVVDIRLCHSDSKEKIEKMADALVECWEHAYHHLN